MERLEGTDIEGYLSHHHDMIILSAIDEARRVAEKDVADTQKRSGCIHILQIPYNQTISTVLIRDLPPPLYILCVWDRWATEEWVTSRQQMMESLGHRSHMWSGGGSTTPGRHTHVMGTTGLTSSVSPDYGQGRGHGHGQVGSPWGDVRSTGGSVRGRFQSGKQSSSVGTKDGKDTRSSVSVIPQQSSLLQAHARIVRKLHQADQQGDRSVNSTLEGRGTSMALVEVGHAAASSLREMSGSGSTAHTATLSPASSMAEAVAGDGRYAEGDGMSMSDRSAYQDLLEMTAAMTGAS